MSYAERRDTWERCWKENRDIPSYFSEGEYEKFAGLRADLYEKYNLKAMREVSEFGCGTGHNLVPLIGTGPRLRGFDWSIQAVKRCNEKGIEGGWFDMLKPIDIKITGVALTVHSLEQLGEDWQPFVDFLFWNKPLLCIHIEPIAELYDETDSHDAACLAYHRKRGYLVGFLNHLRELSRNGKAEIIEVRKSPRWGVNHDAYSVVVWRPL